MGANWYYTLYIYGCPWVYEVYSPWLAIVVLDNVMVVILMGIWIMIAEGRSSFGENWTFMVLQMTLLIAHDIYF